MLKIYNKMNMITLMVCSVLLGMFYGVTEYIYFLFMLIAGVLFIILFKYKQKIIIDKILFFSSIAIIIHMFLITLLFNRNFLDLSRIIVLILPFIITIMLISLYGSEYITNGLKQLQKIFFYINLYGIFEFLTKNNPIIYLMPANVRPSWLLADAASYRSFTIFIHPIIYAVILLIMFWINMFLNDNKRSRYINIILIIINLYATQARGSWLTFASILIIYYSSTFLNTVRVKFPFKRVINLLMVLIFLGCISFTPPVQIFFFNILQRFEQLKTTSGSVSAQQRLGALEVILNDIIEDNFLVSLIGRGYLNIETKMRSFTVVIEGFKNADNQYLTILWDFGWIGLIIYLILFIVILKKCFKVLNRNYRVYLYIILSVFFNMFFFEAFGWYIISTIFYISLAYICISKKENKKITLR